MGIQVQDLKIGDMITASSWGGGRRTGRITEIYPVVDDEDEGIKNGRPGVSCDDVSEPDGWWCYQDQILLVHRQ